jgi:hypothetical protein
MTNGGGGTLRVLGIYIVLLFAGQAAAVGIGLMLDSVSKTAALAAFIPIYYAMYWVAWRLALLIADRSPETQPQTKSAGSPAKIAALLLAPTLLVADLAD